MLYLRSRLFITGLFLFGLTAHAAHFPRGCEVSGFGYSGRYLILNAEGRQTFFLLQNRSTDTIQLERHETRDVFMSPKLQTFLASSQWGAFASDEQNLNFQCSIKTDETLKPINCNEVLEICQYPRAKFALSNMGNYWVSTNKTQDLIIKEAVAKGVYLKW